MYQYILAYANQGGAEPPPSTHTPGPHGEEGLSATRSGPPGTITNFRRHAELLPQPPRRENSQPRSIFGLLQKSRPPFYSVRYVTPPPGKRDHRHLCLGQRCSETKIKRLQSLLCFTPLRTYRDAALPSPSVFLLLLLATKPGLQEVTLRKERTSFSRATLMSGDDTGNIEPQKV